MEPKVMQEMVRGVSSLTDEQNKVLSILPILPAVLSAIASGTILHRVYLAGFKTPYQRILFGLSASDIVYSVTWALQAFLLPSETSQRVWSFGNDATCSATGFFTQLGLSAMLYNGGLSFYYLLTIRFGVKEETFASTFEVWVHAYAIGFPLVTAITGAFMGVYHELEVGPSCWITNYPEGCREANDCQSPIIAWAFAGFNIVVALIAIVVSNIVIYRSVNYQLLRGRRHSMNADVQNNRIKAVATQAFLYVAAFMTTYIWSMVLRVMESETADAATLEASVYTLLIVQAIVVPSAGIFNLCIYLRPRYMHTRAAYPLESRLWVVRRSLYGASVRRPGACETQQSSATQNQPPNALPSIEELFHESLADLPAMFHSSFADQPALFHRSLAELPSEFLNNRAELPSLFHDSLADLPNMFHNSLADLPTMLHNSVANLPDMNSDTVLMLEEEEEEEPRSTGLSGDLVCRVLVQLGS